MTTMTTTKHPHQETAEALSAPRLMDADGAFFAQDDWEFQLDTMCGASNEALQAHLNHAPHDHDTASLLKRMLLNRDQLHVTLFD